jgi:hypothetical protein
MPIVNTYYSSDKHKQMVLSHIDDLKGLVAKQLTCNDIQLKTNEITVRLLQTPREGMISDIELEIFAHAFSERVEKQDEICRAIRTHIMNNVPVLKDVRVWLVLSELGHSWET